MYHRIHIDTESHLKCRNIEMLKVFKGVTESNSVKNRRLHDNILHFWLMPHTTNL